MSKKALSSSHQLVKLGLSNNEAKVYQTLLKEGSLSVKEIAKRVSVFPSASYRVLNKLIKKGLISISGKHPALYRAISPSIGLDSFVKNKIVGLETLKDAALKTFKYKAKQDQTRIDLMYGGYEFFLNYANLAKEARNEILIISIGEPVPDEVVLANRDALEKGVKIKLIVHKSDKNNRELLLRWKKMGLKVKHYHDWGFHLVVFDKKTSLLSVNNPKNTNERIGLKIFSKGLSKALGDYFISVWEKAKDIK
ncbi:TrmB family transcriptional regulator [Patescibacteria group bacterium]